MKLALRELRRRPGRFGAAGLILTLIALLLMFLGGLLDGLIRSSTGAMYALDGDVVVYTASAEDSFLRSRIEPTLRSTVDGVDGVASSAGIGVVQLGARLADKGPRDLLDVVVFGPEAPPLGVDALPGDGEAIADTTLQEQGVQVGTELSVGPARSTLTVVGFVEDTQYLGQAALWTNPETWRTVLTDNRPDQQLGDGVFQALTVRVDDGAVAADVADAIDIATGRSTASLTVVAAAEGLPGVEQQTATFNQIIGVTVGIAVVVVALFFALLTVERASLYGVLKAVGARSGTLFGGLVLQAVVLSAVACVIAGSAAIALDAVIPPGSIPLRISGTRIGQSAVFLLVAAVIGCAFSLRRLLRVDPASAIGSGS
ncbi:MAG: ABC transporter permease [Acidimicrobiales bacterium]|nr:ABC transporter permease [Acidimicrobiales bacterium]